MKLKVWLDPVPVEGAIPLTTGTPGDAGTVHEPTDVQPVFVVDSAARAKTVLSPVQLGKKVKSNVTVTDVELVVTVVVAARKMHWLFETTFDEPGTTLFAPLVGSSYASETVWAVAS